MIKEVFAVFDKRSQLYGDLMTCRNKVEAMRNFEQACLNDRSPLAKYPNDFDLVKICEFSDEEGIVSLNIPPVPKFVVAASDYVNNVVADD